MPTFRTADISQVNRKRWKQKTILPGLASYVSVGLNHQYELNSARQIPTQGDAAKLVRGVNEAKL